MVRTAVLVRFAADLRSEGIPVGPTCASDLLEALETVGAARGEDVYLAFRSLTVAGRDQYPLFHRVFLRHFSSLPFGPPAVEEPTVVRTWEIRRPTDDGLGDGGSDADEMDAITGASAVERLAGKDFAELTPAEQAEVRSMIARMLWRPADALSRRRRVSRSGDRPDLRRTFRYSVGPEGDLMRIASSERKIRKRPLLFIADVSGSMERYSEMLLYFAHASRARLGKLEAFVFSTRITRITRELQRRDPVAAIADVASAVSDWSGGTKIGDALAAFNREWSRRVTRGGPIALIVSDGWDRGDPEVLSREMDRLARSVHRVVWLNPLAGRAGYAPETRGLRAALPYVDDFLAAGNLANLTTLVALLESVPQR